MRTTTGTVVAVQENRFRLVDDGGRARLFLLAHDADLEAQDLPQLQRDQTRVTVHHKPAPDRIADLACRVTEPATTGGAP